MYFLKIQQLSKQFTQETVAVNNINLTINEGEIVCLLGPSGCGKTTLLRLIAGLEQADTGQILFRGKNIRPIPPHQRDFGMMFQDFALFPHKNVFDNVAFGLAMRGNKPDEIKSRVTEILDLVDLQGFEMRDIAQLSGGEQQRVALARSLAPGPRLLMLDEPLGALDRALRERLMLELRQILKRVGLTAIYVTHDQTEAFAIADRLVVLNRGQIEQIGPPQEVYHQPATPFVARFLGFENLLTGTVGDKRDIQTAIGSLHVSEPLPPTGHAVMVLIKPDAAHLEAMPESSDSISAKLTSIDNLSLPQQSLKRQGIITATSFRGKYKQVWVKIATEVLMFEIISKMDWQVNSQIIITLNPQGILLIQSD